MPDSDIRKIPFNYTSADDSQVLRLLIGDAGFHRLQKSRFLKTAGPVARPLLRFYGDMFMLRRNPFVRHDLIVSTRRHRQFFNAVGMDLEMVFRFRRWQRLVRKEPQLAGAGRGSYFLICKR